MWILVLLLSFGTSTGQDLRCRFGYSGDNSEAFNSGANDIIVARQSDGTMKSTPIIVQVRMIYHYYVQDEGLVFTNCGRKSFMVYTFTKRRVQ